MMKKRWIRFSSVGLAVGLVAILVVGLLPSGVSITGKGVLSLSTRTVLAVEYPSPGEVISKRTANSKTTYIGDGNYAWDGTIGSIHYEDNGWQEIDNEFLPAVAPWDWQMLEAGYYIRVKEDFTAGQILEFEVQRETVQLQPMALEWTNDLDQIQQISMPQNVAPVISNPEVDLLPAVGMPSHQGTIRWDDAYGEGIDFEWQATTTRLVKVLEIENLSKLPVPEQYILDGGNPVLRLNLIFDPPSKQVVDIIVDGQVWDQTSNAQTFGIIEFVKNGEVLWGFMPLLYWDSGDGRGQSVATLEKRGNKLYISIRVPYDWLQTAVYPVFIDIDVDKQIADTNANDGSSGDAGFDVNIIKTGQDSSFDVFHSFLRWTGVSIGGTIGVNSYIDLRALAWAGSALMEVYGVDEDNPAAPTSVGEFNADPLTNAVITWDGGFSSGWNQSPGLATIFQELVNTYTISNDAVMVQVKDDGSARNNYNKANDYNNAPSAYNAKLHIEYGEPPAEADISNAPTSIAYGIVAANTTYWSDGAEPSWPLVDADAYFTLTNNGDTASITILATNFSGGVGWILGVPGENIVRVTSFKEGDGSGDGITLTTSPQAFISGLVTDIDWELKMETPTIVTDGVIKTSTITLTATLD